MSFSVVAAVLAADITPVSVKMMAVVVAWHVNPDKGGACWASLPTMARECGMSVSHAKRALRMLKQAGLLEVLRAGAGGDRRAGTTHYGFSLQALADLASPVHRRPRFAGEPGAELARSERSGRDKDPQPGPPVNSNPGRRRALPGPPAAPKRNERKPEASLSLKAPSAPDSTGGRPVDAGDARAGAKVVSIDRARKQPASDLNVVRLRCLAAVAAEPVPEWLNHDDALSAVGVRLGVGTLADARAQGRDRLNYVRAVLEARAAVIKQVKAHKAELTRGATAAELASVTLAASLR